MSESVTRHARAEDGVRIAFEFIEGRDPVLFLSPSLGSQPTLIEWAPPWRAYRDVLRADNAMANLAHRGIGNSGPPGGPVGLAELVLDLEAVANALPDRELYVFASEGGCVPALEFVAAHEERVRGLFLNGPTRFGLPPVMRAAMKADMQEALYMSGRYLFDWDGDEELLKTRSREWAEGLPPDVFWETVAACEDYDFATALKRLSLPTILRGYDYDREEVAELAAECPEVLLDMEKDQLLAPAQAARQRALMDPYLIAKPATPVDGLTPPVGMVDLTPSQLRVLQLAARGLSDKAIAAELSIAPGTARRHMSDILSRTGQPNRTAAVRFALDRGMIE